MTPLGWYIMSLIGFVVLSAVMGAATGNLDILVIASGAAWWLFLSVVGVQVVEWIRRLKT